MGSMLLQERKRNETNIEMREQKKEKEPKSRLQTAAFLGFLGAEHAGLSLESAIPHLPGEGL